jgi:hypothetical protein
MKRNYVPKGRGYSRAQIEAHNLETDALCEGLQPVAMNLYRQALMETAGEGAETLAEEAQDMLRAICRGEVQGVLDSETQELRKTLAQAFARAGDAEEIAFDEPYVEGRARDLSRAVVSFWMDLGQSELERFSKTVDVLTDLLVEGRMEACQEYQAICSRFGIESKDSWELLDYLHVLATHRIIRAHAPAPRPQIPVPAASFVRVFTVVARAPARPARRPGVQACLLTPSLEEQSKDDARVGAILGTLDDILMSKAKALGKKAGALAACQRVAFSTGNALAARLKEDARYS